MLWHLLPHLGGDTGSATQLLSLTNKIFIPLIFSPSVSKFASRWDLWTLVERKEVLLYFKQGIIREEECINKTSCMQSGRLSFSICICLGLAEDRTPGAGDDVGCDRRGQSPPARSWCCTASQGCYGLVLQKLYNWQARERDSFPSLVSVLCRQFAYLS